jgi:Tol biopolymer transport system component
MKFDRFDFRVWGVVASLGLVLLAVILIGDQVGARVVRTFPVDGGIADASNRIGLEFAQPMQVKTVETRFEIDPPTPGKLEWAGRQMWFVADRPLTPGVQYTARLRAGGASQGGQPAKRDVTWRFRAREPWVVFLSFANNSRTLWRIRSSGGVPEPLEGVDGAYAFAVSPDGQQIVYSIANHQKGVDLWLMTSAGQDLHLLVDCGPDNCSAPDWSPDGSLIAYSRAPAGIAPGRPDGALRIWIVTLATAQTMPLIPDSQVLGSSPSWGPDGRRIAFFDQSINSIRILNWQTKKEAIVLPTRLGAMGTWSPDGNRMLFNNLILTGTQSYVTLDLADLTTQTITTVLRSQVNSVDFSISAWSPTGEWVVVGRRSQGSDPSQQLWLMRPDGKDSHPITDDPRYTYSGYLWDPWGQSIMFQRYETGNPSAAPETMIWSLATNQMRPVAQDAALAVWAP